MKTTRNLFYLFLLISLLISITALTSCRNNTAVNHDIPLSQPLTALPQIWNVPPQDPPATVAEEFTTTNLLQLSPLTQGELIVTMHTSMGDILMRFFPEEAPMAVENFLTHAWNGYYDGISFHRVMPGFMMQGGCPEGTGMGGDSIWGHTFGQELSPELRHFRGALAMAQTRMPSSIGSQFYIVQSTDIGPSHRSDFVQFLELYDQLFQEFPDGSYVTVGDIFPEESLRYFIENGGTPFLDWHFSDNPHTVFGHVVTGMDVVDAIVSVRTEGGGDTNPHQHRPVEPVLINGFTFQTYGG